MKFEEAVATFTREQMYDLYINKGMSKEAVSKTIGISDQLVSKMLSYYEITKTKEQIQESKRKPKRDSSRYQKKYSYRSTLSRTCPMMKSGQNTD